MLGFGIPDRANWPAGLLDSLRKFRQGDVVRDLPFFYWGDPDRPLFSRTREYHGHPVGVIEMPEGWFFPYGMVATQTCDIVGEGGDRDPHDRLGWIQMCPVFDANAPHPTEQGKHLLDGGVRKLIAQGRKQGFIRLPSLADGFWVADLQVEIPVERGWLASHEPISGFPDEGSQQEVGRRLAWLRSRPALDARLVEAVQSPLLSAFKSLRQSDRDFYERMHEVVLEVAIRSASRLNATNVEVFVLHEGQMGDDEKAWWKAQWDVWNEAANEREFTLLPLAIEDLNELSAAVYRELTRLPLSQLSSEPAWYGPDPEKMPE